MRHFIAHSKIARQAIATLFLCGSLQGFAGYSIGSIELLNPNTTIGGIPHLYETTSSGNCGAYGDAFVDNGLAKIHMDSYLQGSGFMYISEQINPEFRFNASYDGPAPHIGATYFDHVMYLRCDSYSSAANGPIQHSGTDSSVTYTTEANVDGTYYYTETLGPSSSGNDYISQEDIMYSAPVDFAVTIRFYLISGFHWEGHIDAFFPGSIDATISGQGSYGTGPGSVGVESYCLEAWHLTLN